MPTVIATLGTIPKGLVKGLEKVEIGGRAETMQITAKLLRKVLETLDLL